MTPRTRLRVLIVGAFTLLAFATHAETRDLNVVPAAQTADVPAADLVARHAPGASYLGATEGIGPAGFWCAARRPHASDDVTYAEWYHLSQYTATTNCIATHDNGATWHFYRVTVWDQDHDGVIELVQWTPLGPWWT
jgi:hypothetical protein